MESLKYALTTTFFPPFHLGGDAIHVELLANELVKRGNEVHVFYGLDAYLIKRGNRKIKEMEKDSSDHHGIHLHHYATLTPRLSTLAEYSFGISSITRKIENDIKKLSPDVLHHHNISGIGQEILGIESPIKLYTAHDHWPICQKSSYQRYDGEICQRPKHCMTCSLLSKRPCQIWRFSNSTEKIFSKIDCIISPSGYMADILISLGGLKNVTVLPNFVPDWENNDHSATFEIPYLLFVGSLEQNKGIDALVSDFLDWKMDTKISLRIVGSGSSQKKIKEKINRDKRGNRVLLEGGLLRKNLASLYRNAIAVIIPSISPENSPLVGLEAYCAGTPLIGTDIGGLPEMINRVSKNYVFHRGDFSKMREIIRSILSNPPDRSRIRLFYEKYYSPESYIKGLRHILDNKSMRGNHILAPVTKGSNYEVLL